MPAYVIVEVETTDAAMMEAYRERVPPTIAAFGGKFLVRGGAMEVLEGGWQPSRVVILEFESIERAKAWWASAEYREPKSMRQRAGRTNMIAVEGIAAPPQVR